jgi:plasmid replication initiation protein
MTTSISENNLVEKSKSLVWAKFRDYTAGELRLLEVYLSRINPRDPESSCVRFSISEYKNLLGLKTLDIRTVKPQIDHFLGNTVSIPIDKEKNTFESFVLFTRARLDFDEQTRTYSLAITCNPDLQPVFFDIAEKGYVKYRLRYTVKMKSQYSILLYPILKDWVNMSDKPHEIGLQKLREQLNATDASYDVYKNLRKRVLDVAVKEINEYSDLNVTYEPVLVARKAVAVTFKMKLKDTEPVIDAESTEVDGSEKKPSHPVRRTLKSVYGDADWNTIAPELDAKQCLSLAKLVEKKLKDEYPTLLPEKKKDAVLNIVSNAYQMVLGDKADIENPCGYLTAAIKNNELGEYATFGVDYMQ